MRAWFESLDLRERILVCVAAAVVGAALFYSLLWQPLHQRQLGLHEEIGQARELTVFVQRVAATARQSSAGNRRPSGGGNRSLLSLVDETTKQRGLKDAVKRIQPEGDQLVRVWLEGAEFDAVVQWLNELSTRHGVAMDNGNLDREDQPGRIKARFTLQRGA